MSEEFKLQSNDMSISIEMTSPDTAMDLDVTGAVFAKTIGYYSPEVSQPEANKMRVEYTASDRDMPPVEPVDIILPAGEKGDDGVGVSSVKQTTTSNADGGNNVVTVTLTNGTTSTFTIKNGSKGSTGATGATGATGKSAYAYAQEGGYTGTETEFKQKLAIEVPTITQEAGESESLVMSQKAVTNLVSGKIDKTKITQNTGNDQDLLMSQAAVTAALENLTALPYGGSREWLENNGDTNQLYQIDGYVWGYIESNGWTRSNTQYLVVSSENEMTNQGGTPYLLRDGNQGTVYTYVAASGDTDAVIVDKIPEDANNGDIFVINPPIVNSVEEMVDESKNYALGKKIYANKEITTEIDPPNVLVHSTATLNARLSSSSASVSANGSPGAFVTDYIAVKDLDVLTPYYARLNWEIIEHSDNKVLFYNSSKSKIGNNIFIDAASNRDFVNGQTILDFKTMYGTAATPTWSEVAYIRLQLFVKPSGTSIVAADIENLEITIDADKQVITGAQWYDTGFTTDRKYRATVTSEEVPAYTNQIPISTDSEGNVVGLIKGYRYNSSDTLVESSVHNSMGFIPVKQGDTVRFQGINFGSTIAANCYLRFYNSAYGMVLTNANPTLTPTNIKEKTAAAFNQFATDYKLTSKGDIAEFTLNSSWSYGFMRFSYLSASSDENPIITVNEEIGGTKTVTTVNLTDVGEYIAPSEAGWDSTSEKKNIIDSLLSTSNNGATAVYSVDGYLYTYIDGASWMETSKYEAPNLKVDGEFSFTSINAISNKTVTNAISDVEIKVKNNANEINSINLKIAEIETGSDSVIIPSFWQNAVDECIAKIKALQVGHNCVTFPFFSDNHQRNGYAGLLISHIMKECHIPYCFFGGDSISNGYIDSEATMIAQDKAFDTIMSYIPNGRFCRAVGNHDGFWNVSSTTGDEYYYNRDQVYDLFLREESIAQNKHFGEDGTYYYIDDIASKVRFIVLNTNGIRNESGSIVGDTFDSTQRSWLQNTALSFDENGWAVVFISHQPISNHYHAGINNAAEVRSIITNYINSSVAYKADIVGWYSGHIHRDRIWTGAAINTKDDSQGEAMGFTQVTITSDHTSIAYDDATKHAVASDDKSHAIDFVTINKSTRTVNITRLGIGNDRSYTY